MELYLLLEEDIYNSLPYYYSSSFDPPEQDWVILAMLFDWYNSKDHLLIFSLIFFSQEDYTCQSIKKPGIEFSLSQDNLDLTL